MYSVPTRNVKLIEDPNEVVSRFAFTLLDFMFGLVSVILNVMIYHVHGCDIDRAV